MFSFPIISVCYSANATDILPTFKIAKPHQPLTLKKKILLQTQNPLPQFPQKIREQAI